MAMMMIVMMMILITTKIYLPAVLCVQWSATESSRVQLRTRNIRNIHYL